MSEGRLGLATAISIGLGGMIGGGIYAVLGVITGIAGAATWAAFALAGVVAACAAYSYVGLNELVAEGDGSGGGGSVTFVQSFTGNSTLAGMIGWTLLVGNVGSMAMYAFAFGEFAVVLPGVPDAVAGIPLRPIVSLLAVGGFVGLNLLGARATGTAENALVAAKVLVLVAFGVAGVAYAVVVSSGPVALGASEFASFDPIMAAAVSFVAFQGWQFLFYDQGTFSDPLGQIPTAVYISIAAAVAIYALVAVATFNLAPEALQSNPHTALTNAAATVGDVVGLGATAGTVISLSALFSTGSAINATLFSTGYLAKGMLSDDLLPDRVGDASATGVPSRTVVGLGIVTAAAAAVGSLSAITAFASLAFIVIFGGMSALAFARRTEDQLGVVAPTVGTVGAAAFFALMLGHLYASERGTFITVCAIAVVVTLAEVLYFERHVIEREIPYLGPETGEGAD